MSLMKIALVVLAFMARSSDASSKWSYTGAAGPKHWPKMFPNCGKSRQSPVNIELCETEHEESCIENNYKGADAKVGMVLKNNGHSAQIDLSHVEGLHTTVFGQKFKPVQVHFHWGRNWYVGSEHTVNGQQFPAEMHFVHMNMKYSTADEAKKHRDGLLVLGTLIRTGAHNSLLQPIFGMLRQIKTQGTNTSVSGLKLTSLMPEKKRDFFYYDGSLTTPTCDQAVKWILFRRVVSISRRQIRKLRSLTYKGKNGAKQLVNNFRPTQPLNGRKIYRSFYK